jgi:hypothetical protein
MRRRTSNRLSLLMLRPAPLASALLDTLRTVRGVSMIDCSLFGMVEDCQLRMPPHSVCEGLGALPEEFPPGHSVFHGKFTTGPNCTDETTDLWMTGV